MQLIYKTGLAKYDKEFMKQFTDEEEINKNVKAIRSTIQSKRTESRMG
jgi:hypothetical protein